MNARIELTGRQIPKMNILSRKIFSRASKKKKSGKQKLLDFVMKKKEAHLFWGNSSIGKTNSQKRYGGTVGKNF